MPRAPKKMIVFQRKGPSGKFEENGIGGHRQKQIRTLDLPASQTRTIRSILKEERTNRNKVLSHPSRHGGSSGHCRTSFPRPMPHSAQQRRH